MDRIRNMCRRCTTYFPFAGYSYGQSAKKLMSLMHKDTHRMTHANAILYHLLSMYLIWRNKSMFLLVWARSFLCVWDINVLVRVLSTHVCGTVRYVTTGSMLQYGKFTLRSLKQAEKTYFFICISITLPPIIMDQWKMRVTPIVVDTVQIFRHSCTESWWWEKGYWLPKNIKLKKLLLGDGCEIGRFWVLITWS